MASLLVQGIRKDDLVIRWGGDEFLILLFNTPINAALRAAEQIRLTIEQMQAGERKVTCSFGLDAIKAEDTLNEIVSRIDTALTRAKKEDKNCVARYKTI